MISTIAIILGYFAMAAGGLLSGICRPSWSLGRPLDLFLGLAGANLGTQLWSMIGVAAGNSFELSLWSILGNILAGFLGALTLLLIISQYKKIFVRKKS